MWTLDTCVEVHGVAVDAFVAGVHGGTCAVREAELAVLDVEEVASGAGIEIRVGG